MFAHAWSMTHAVKLSALSAVERLFFYLCAPVFDIAHALCTFWLSTRALHGHCGTHACLLWNLQYLMSLAQAILIRGEVTSFVC